MAAIEKQGGRIEWEMDEVTGIYPINLIIGDEVIDMRQNSYDDILGSEFNQFSVQMGEENLSNDSFLISEFELSDPFPNPFNPKTQIEFNIPVSDFIEIKIYDINGKMLDVLYDGYIQSGEHTLDWNAEQLSSGVYIIKSMYQNNLITKKAVLIK